MRSAAAVLLLLSPVALAGCSAGQVSQTATQVRDRTGGTGQAGDLTVRAVQLVHPPGGVHEVGDEVQLTMAIANGGRVDDRLVGVSGADFDGTTVTGPVATVGTATDPASADPDLADGVARDAAPPAADAFAVDVLVPAREAVLVGTGTPPLVLSGLIRRIDAAQSIELTLTFARAGETTVQAVVGPPPGVLPRGPVHEFGHVHGS